MLLEKIEPGMLLLSRNGKLCVVTEVRREATRYPVVYQLSPGKTTYIGAADFFTYRLGRVNLARFETAANAELARAGNVPVFVSKALVGKKIGDMIKVRYRGSVLEVEYRGYNGRARKNPVQIRMGGRNYRCPLSMLVE